MMKEQWMWGELYIDEEEGGTFTMIDVCVQYLSTGDIDKTRSRLVEISYGAVV